MTGDSNLGPPGDSPCWSAEPQHTGMDQSCPGFQQSSQTGLTPDSNAGGRTGPAPPQLSLWFGRKSLAPHLLCPPCLSPLSSPSIPTWVLSLPALIPPTPALTSLRFPCSPLPTRRTPSPAEHWRCKPCSASGCLRALGTAVAQGMAVLPWDVAPLLAMLKKDQRL